MPYDPAQRLTSIVRLHGAIQAELGTQSGHNQGDLADLLPVELPVDQQKALRLRSVLDVHEILFGRGIFIDDPEVIRECGVLRKAVSSGTQPEPLAKRIIVENLGRSVMRLGIAVPLFGPLGPGFVPSNTSVIVLRRDRLPSEIQIVVIGYNQGVTVDAVGLGFRIRAEAPLVRITYSHEGETPAAGTQSENTRTVRLTGGASVSVTVDHEGSNQLEVRSGPEFGDYLFAFPQQPRLKRSLVRYLTRLHVGRFQVMPRLAEDLSSWVVLRILDHIN